MHSTAWMETRAERLRACLGVDETSSDASCHNLSRSMSASALKAAHEKKIAEANEPPGKKEVVWTPKNNDTTGAHNTAGFKSQTAKKVAGGPPPPKKIGDLP